MAEIRYRVGFGDQVSFSRAFRRQFGCACQVPEVPPGMTR